MTRKHKPRYPFAWFGEKGTPQIRNAVFDTLPRHEKYIELFGILLAKKQTTVEACNDVNRGLINFFCVICDPENFVKLMVKLSAIVISRILFEECART